MSVDGWMDRWMSEWMEGCKCWGFCIVALNSRVKGNSLQYSVCFQPQSGRCKLGLLCYVPGVVSMWWIATAVTVCSTQFVLEWDNSSLGYERHLALTANNSVPRLQNWIPYWFILYCNSPFFIFAHAEMETDTRLTLSPVFSQRSVCFQC